MSSRPKTFLRIRWTGCFNQPHPVGHQEACVLLPPSPDRKRILFGGRVSLQETDPRKSGPRLLAELVRLFPELAQTRISHSWAGIVAYTFDTLMHCGADNNLFHAMGYCGSGVGMAGYLGSKVGKAAAGLEKTSDPSVKSRSRPGRFTREIRGSLPRLSRFTGCATAWGFDRCGFSPAGRSSADAGRPMPQRGGSPPRCCRSPERRTRVTGSRFARPARRSQV